jgi:hypothetical protein
MRDFKFLTDNDDDDLQWFNEWDIADLDRIANEDELILRRLDDTDAVSWMWDDGYVPINADTQPYELITRVYNGIIDFLAGFPTGYVVVVNRITGVASERTHTAETEREGWGFDIQNDLIEVTYYHFLNTDHA